MTTETDHGPLANVQIQDPVEWIDAKFPPQGKEGLWSEYVLVETNKGRLFRIAHFGPRGPWQHPHGMNRDESPERWARVEWHRVLASNASWIPERIRDRLEKGA